MAKPLKVLIVEDNERDAAMLVRELRQGGYEPEAERVDTEDAMNAALDRQAWEIVLADFSMPRFSAPAALAVVRGRGLDVPFIIVSGTIGEEAAVAAMRAGAGDFIPKGSLARLLPAVARELREAMARAQRKELQEQLDISERMATVGMLSASIAHEINNPLTVIAANLEFVVQHLDALASETAAIEASADAAAGARDRLAIRLASTLAKTAEPLRDAQESAERVRTIVRDLKIFSRSADEEQRGPVDIERVLDVDRAHGIERDPPPGSSRPRLRRRADGGRKRGAARPGVSQSHHQRRAGHSGRQRGGKRDQAVDADGRRRPDRRRGLRQRGRDTPGDPRAHLRSVLHHQGGRHRYRPRPRDLPSYRHAPRRRTLRGQRAGPGHDLPGFPAARRSGRAGRRGGCGRNGVETQGPHPGRR